LIRFIKQNAFYIIATIALLTVVVVNLWIEKNENLNPLIFIFLGVLTLPVVFSKIERTLYLIILLAPISIGILLPFVQTKISVPSELLSALIALIFLIKVLMGLKINKAILQHPITWIISLDLMWTLIASLNSSDPGVSIKRFVLKVTFVFVYYFLFTNYFNTSKKQRNLYFIYALGLIYPIIHAIMLHSKRGFGQATSFSISQPYYSDHTIYGACIAFIIPFFIIMSRKQNRRELKYGYIYPVLLVMLVLAEILSYSRASWISLMACLLFYLVTKLKLKGYHILTFLVLIITIFTFNFQSIYTGLRETETKYDDNVGAHLTSVTNLQNDASNLERINRWVCAYRMFEERPLVGFGPGTYQFEYDKFQSPEFMTRISTHHGNRGNAHSEYLSYLSEYGIFGLLIFITLMFYTIHIALKLLYSSISKNKKMIVYGSILGLITFYSHGLFNTFSDYEKMSILFYGSTAILVAIDISEKEKHIEVVEENS
jgi:O-antigen ligase